MEKQYSIKKHLTSLASIAPCGAGPPLRRFAPTLRPLLKALNPKTMRNIYSTLIAIILSPLTATIGYGLAFHFRLPRDFLDLVATKGLYHMIGPNIYFTSFAY